jgi:hypothetical protein
VPLALLQQPWVMSGAGLALAQQLKQAWLQAGASSGSKGEQPQPQQRLPAATRGGCVGPAAIAALADCLAGCGEAASSSCYAVAAGQYSPWGWLWAAWRGWCEERPGAREAAAHALSQAVAACVAER